jgi:AcrR family transcriptional regulator
VDTPVELPVLSPLPQIEQAPAERADALRNRERILVVAEQLFAERGAACVSMDDIAEAAGVGKGTLFRRFGSRAALALALLSEHESELQEGLIRGAPPLGPGAPALERLVAFGEARLDLLAHHSDLIAAAERGADRLVSPPYIVYRLHMTMLLREAAPACDAPYLVEALLASLGASEFLHMREQLGLSLEAIKAGWRELVVRLLAAEHPSCAPARAPAASATPGQAQA